MSSLYKRGNKIWIKYKDNAGRIQRKPSGFEVGQEDKAETLRKRLERQLAEERRAGVDPSDGRVTLNSYAKTWIERRYTYEIRSADTEESKLRNHVLPRLGRLPLDEIRPRQINDYFIALKQAGKLAPKTIHNIKGIMTQLFNSAIIDELISGTPMILEKNVLPINMDADPEWRENAIFEKHEVELLMTDERLPLDRRVLYALLFLGAFRTGEVCGLRFKDWNRESKPLGGFSLRRQYHTRTKKELAVLKSGVTRRMPVHPLLAKILAEWKLSGWAQTYGRAPQETDLISPLPFVRGKGRRVGGPEVHRRQHTVWKKMQDDLVMLGLRRRRVHDTRRTFISLARAVGARMDILKWCTHGPPRKAIMDKYTEPPWDLRCEQVSCVQISLRTGAVITLENPLTRAQSGHSGS